MWLTNIHNEPRNLDFILADRQLDAPATLSKVYDDEKMELIKTKEIGFCAETVRAPIIFILKDDSYHLIRDSRSAQYQRPLKGSYPICIQNMTHNAGQPNFAMLRLQSTIERLTAYNHD